MRFDDLVIIARVSHPIPFRTRTLNLFALMVLCLKARESKSLPDLLTALHTSLLVYCCLYKNLLSSDKRFFFVSKKLALDIMFCYENISFPKYPPIIKTELCLIWYRLICYAAFIAQSLTDKTEPVFSPCPYNYASFKPPYTPTHTKATDRLNGLQHNALVSKEFYAF